MRYLVFITLVVSSMSVSAATQKFCDEIQRLRIWAGGSDEYGIWVEYKNNPEACPGGFFLRHADQNKNYVMSFLLAEKAKGSKVCIQAVTNAMIGSRCRLNYVYNP